VILAGSAPSQTTTLGSVKDGGLARIFGEVFGSASEKMGSRIEQYAEIYGLPLLTENSTSRASVQTNPHPECFLAVIPYNHKRETLFSEASGPNSTRHILSEVLLSAEEDFEGAVRRIVKDQANLSVCEIQPIARIIRSNPAGIAQDGLVFLAELAPSQDATASTLVGRFASEPDLQLTSLEAEIVERARDVLRQKIYATPEGEVTSARRYGGLLASAIHHRIFKPLMYVLASRQLKRSLAGLVPKGKSMLDVSAGDDSFLLTMCSDRQVDFAIANDIIWGQMESSRRTARKQGLPVLFTSHNILDLPFKVLFDVVLFKNTLHHLRSQSEVIAALQNLKKLGRNIVIVDVERPTYGAPRIVNTYYRRLLNDAGEHFWTRSQFRALISEVFGTSGTKFSEIRTLKGVYMVAVVKQEL
jgi:2-polyprenyl-3-methyl-5-hydroxy-6-metoxy-1,4-benzoquinol methylase